jgi:diguanylate cyclase (GGDEF)-like protein
MNVSHAIKDLQLVRGNVCDRTLVVFALISVPALAASLSRIPSIGWSWVMGVQITTVALLYIITIFRESIPYYLRAGYIVLLLSIVGLTGMLKFGLIAGAIPLLIVTPILTTVYFGARVGILHVAGIMLLMTLIAFGKIQGVIASDFDMAFHASLISTWATFLLVSLVAFVAPVTATIMVVRHLTEALEKARRNEEELELQVAHRTKELVKANQVAEQMAFTDELTGLSNRRAYFKSANEMDLMARRHTRPYAVLMLDIDHFKAINDQWGHERGDAVLKALSNLLASSFRRADIVGRIGGEEFSILLPETDIQKACSLAEHLRQVIEAAIVPSSSGEIRFTASIGVASCDETTATFDQVLMNADVALYEAKNNGRNQVCSYEHEIAMPASH